MCSAFLQSLFMVYRVCCCKFPAMPTQLAQRILTQKCRTNFLPCSAVAFVMFGVAVVFLVPLRFGFGVCGAELPIG
jgi:hypothetical protein